MKLKKSSLRLYLLAFLVIVLGAAVFYYLKYYKIGADTKTVKGNLTCVIKITDAVSGRPIEKANASLFTLPNSRNYLSDKNGCVALPSNTSLNDFYQVSIYKSGYKASAQYLSLTGNVFNGKEKKSVKLTPQPVKTSLNGSENKINQISSSLVDTAKAATSNFVDVIWIHVVEESFGFNSDVQGAAVTMTYKGSAKTVKPVKPNVLFECATDNKGYCYADGQTPAEMNNSGLYPITLQVAKTGYKTYTKEYKTLSEAKTDYSGEYWVNLIPDLAIRNIGPIVGESNLRTNCADKRSYEFYLVATPDRIQKVLVDKTILKKYVADYLANIQCAISQSDQRSASEIANLRVYMLDISDPNMSTKYLSSASRAGSAYNIMLNNTTVYDKTASNTKKFNQVAYSYGLISYPYIGWVYEAGKKNLENIRELISFKGGTSSQDLLMVNYRQNEPSNLELISSDVGFWAKSYSLWLANSFSTQLALDPASLSDVIMSFDGTNTSTKTANIYAFWKKVIATIVGSYCHPSLIDDNGLKQGDLTSVENNKESFVKGGPLAPSVIYNKDQIVAGVPITGSSLTINYKKLLPDYTPTTMTDENFSVVPYSTGKNAINLASYFPTVKSIDGKNAWPDTLTTDANRCGIYERGMLAQSDKTADIKQDNVKRGPYPLFGMRSYELKGYYRCSKTEAYKEITIKPKVDLDSSKTDVELFIDLASRITCPKATTPVAPGVKR